MTRFGTLAVAAFTLGALSLTSACATDYVHDAAAFYPEDFESSYTLVGNCIKSDPHGGKYVLVYANTSANTAFNDTAVTTFPEGSIFVKAQYDASDCSGAYAALTAMRKDAAGSGASSDWKWQSIGGDGGIELDAYDPSGCLGCHQSGTGKDLVKTMP